MISQVFQWLDATLTEALPELEYVEYFTEETDSDGNSARVYGSPCVLIRFGPQNWQQGRNGVQQAELNIDVMIVTSVIVQGKERIRSNAGANLQLAQKVYQLLQGRMIKLSAIEGFEQLADTPEDVVILNTIERRDSSTSHELSRYLVTTIGFAGLARDYSATPAVRQMLLSLNMQTNLVH